MDRPPLRQCCRSSNLACHSRAALGGFSFHWRPGCILIALAACLNQQMESQQPQRAQPFSSLIAVSSLLTAALFVAGFSYRWSYYYNFGVSQIVYGLTLQSFLIAATEMIREPASLSYTVPLLILAVVILELFLAVIRILFLRILPHLSRKVSTFLLSSRFDYALAADCARGATLLFTIYALASSIGYSHFLTAIEDSPYNPLPLATTMLSSSSEVSFLRCGAGFNEKSALIGDLKGFRDKMLTNITCSSQSTGSWRLLHRDSDFVYLFRSLKQNSLSGSKPLTIVLPSSSVQGVLLNEAS